MTAQDFDRLEQLALKQAGKPLGTAIAVNPRDLLELIRNFRQHGTQSDAQTDTPQ